MKHPDIEKLEKQALLDRIAELEKRIEKLEKKEKWQIKRKLSSVYR